MDSMLYLLQVVAFQLHSTRTQKFRLFYVPPQLRNVPIEQLRFPFNYIARGVLPTIPNVVSLESFAHFGIYFSPDVYTIADSLTGLRSVLQDLPDGFVRWFPFVFQEQAYWFIHGGGGLPFHGMLHTRGS